MKRRTENRTVQPSRKRSELKRIIFSFQFSVFSFLLLVLIVASCSSRKKMVSPMAHVANYEWMSAKMNGELITENGEIPFTGSLKMRRDSTVWLSASVFMGMESIRTLMTQDSVFVINRMNQTYLSEPFSTLVEVLGASIQHPTSLREIQSKLLGNGSSDHVELQYGPYKAKIQYSEIHWDEPTSFPIKINKNYERIKL